MFFFQFPVAETSGDLFMFTTELVLDTKALTFDPSEDNFQVSAQIVNSCVFCNRFLRVIGCLSLQESFSEIFGQMKQTAMAVGLLTQDPDFDLLTGRKDDRVGNVSSTALPWDVAALAKIVRLRVQTPTYRDAEASNLEGILSSDEHLQHLLQSMKVCLIAALARQHDSARPLRQRCKQLMCVYVQASIHSAFRAARVYSHTLERFRLFFKENEGLDLDLLQQQDHGRSSTTGDLQ